jgi:hypothetical protein
LQRRCLDRGVLCFDDLTTALEAWIEPWSATHRHTGRPFK